MKINFSALGGGKTSDNVLNPREIFSLLPRKSGAYQYLRDVQSEVLNRWFKRNTEKDIVLKMNTGSGKTIVGLLILKSCVNEGLGPAVYIVPDNYLRQQVIAEAGNLGIAVAEDESNLSFLRGKSILVINVHKLINGRSVFGVGGEGVKIPIGSIVVDDVHACLSTTESQFTLKVTASDGPYADLLALFSDDLRQQSETGYLEIEAQDPQKNMALPFWAWQSKLNKVSALLHKHREDSDSLLFAWPLIKEDLRLCSCVFGGGEVEVSPKCLPIDIIPSFVQAKRRIFMSATLSDDSVLVTHFDVDQRAISHAVVPSDANDIGDRMVLIPQELNPDLTSEDLKGFLKLLSKKYNIAVIVPSGFRAGFWADVSDLTLTARNIYDGIAQMKKQHVGLVVLVNKYDGIDLPYDACRILVIDGLPDVRRRIDKVDQALLSDSEYFLGQMIQRIEQGMGRAIRANDDHCVVILMGHTLTKQLCSPAAINRFTPATKAQFHLSMKLARQIGQATLDQLKSVMSYLLNRDAEWMNASKGALVDLKYDPKGTVSQVALARRKSFNYGRIRDYTKATAALQEIVDGASEPRLRGWLKLQLADFTNFVDPAQSQVILASAVADNSFIVRPIEGIRYGRLDPVKVEQAQRIAQFVAGFSDTNSFVIEAHSLLEALVFAPESSEQFECAIKSLAQLLGFEGQRPERETGKGPDVLWALGHMRYLVIECKNGATAKEISKQDSDQLSGSMNWFASMYDTPCTAVPIMIHPVEVFSRQASPHRESRIITTAKLDALQSAVRKFVKSIALLNNLKDHKEIARLLSLHGLTADQLVARYTLPHKTSR